MTYTNRKLEGNLQIVRATLTKLEILASPFEPSELPKTLEKSLLDFQEIEENLQQLLDSIPDNREAARYEAEEIAAHLEQPAGPEQFERLDTLGEVADEALFKVMSRLHPDNLPLVLIYFSTLENERRKSAAPVIMNTFSAEKVSNSSKLANIAQVQMPFWLRRKDIRQFLSSPPDKPAVSDEAKENNNLGLEAALPAPTLENLIADLQNPDAEVRLNAVVELGRHREEQVVAELCRTLLEDPDSSVRYLAARSLGKIGDSHAAEALEMAALQDFEESDSGDTVSRAATVALRLVRDNSLQ